MAIGVDIVEIERIEHSIEKFGEKFLNMVGEIMGQFDDIWRGSHCPGCKRKKYCADYKDLLQK